MKPAEVNFTIRMVFVMAFAAGVAIGELDPPAYVWIAIPIWVVVVFALAVADIRAGR